MPHSLPSQLARDILVYIQSKHLAVGTRLPERALAEELRVSRSPIRAALLQLQSQAMIERLPEGGFVVAAGALQAPAAPAVEIGDVERVYLQIAQDRLDGKLPERITENELMRRYALTRSQLTEILRRVVHEGWVERLPGHGWSFTEGMTSPDSYAQSYRFRVLIEPAGILEPTFTLDAYAIKQCRDEQQKLVDGAVYTASPAEIFDANTRLHETIASCSGNAFILDSLIRLNRIRRLMEYKKSVDREQALRRCKEHLVLIDLLLDQQLEHASDYMRLHLRDASREKQMPAA